MRVAFLGMILLQASVAMAANWPPLPVACLPARALPWIVGQPFEAQLPCHCPDPDLYPCPTDWRAWYPEQYPDAVTDLPNKDTVDTTNFVARCCIQPVCPEGTQRAGEPIPVDGQCDPAPVCPNDTFLAGDPIPPSGDCLCPIGTDRAGESHNPDGSCNNPSRVCPEGTYLAGQPIPPDGDCLCPSGTFLEGQHHNNEGTCNSRCAPNECDLSGLMRARPDITYCSGECVPDGQDAFVAPAKSVPPPGVGTPWGGFLFICRISNGQQTLFSTGQWGSGGIGNCR